MNSKRTANFRHRIPRRVLLISGNLFLCLAFFSSTDRAAVVAQERERNDATLKMTLDVADNSKEARTRARILFETLHGTLQVMHRDFFRKDESVNIPSRSLEDVFKELEKQHKIQLKWISVELEPLNIDNAPETAFEKLAATKLKSGLKEFESIKADRFQYAGRINLGATCLSCHAPRRNNNDERAAGLIIQMPIRQHKSSRELPRSRQ